MKKITCLLIFFAFSFSQAQTTVGLLYSDNNNISSGYTLFGYKQSNDFYLINNCGEVVNKWEGDRKIGVGYILENGNILKSGANNLELRDWDNNLLWHVDLSTFNIRQHHDIEPLPNGNILVLARDNYTIQEAIDEGRDPAIISMTGFTSERVVEIEPVGTNSLNVVWEWKFWDHLIQDFDNTKPNFGVVVDHPELLNLNLETRSNNTWLHTNGIDYNPVFDQIVISSRNTSEIYVIDHSTTTAEAAGNTGGTYNKGGDFLWRFGNQANYGQGTAADQELFGPHDPKWIPNGLPNAGQISVFNNGLDRLPEFSSIHLVDSHADGSGAYSLVGNLYEGDYSWSWNGNVLGDVVYSVSQSGVKMQPNGNFVFCEATSGKFTEVTSSGTVVWSYVNPIITGGIYNQGDTVVHNANPVFRAEKYEENYAGFAGKDLTSQGIIENVNTVSDACITILSTDDFELNNVQVYPNPFKNEINIGGLEDSYSVTIYSLEGKIVYQKENMLNNSIVDLSEGMSKGVYLMSITTEDGKVSRRKIMKY